MHDLVKGIAQLAIGAVVVYVVVQVAVDIVNA